MFSLWNLAIFGFGIIHSILAIWLVKSGEVNLKDYPLIGDEDLAYAHPVVIGYYAAYPLLVVCLVCFLRQLTLWITS